MPGKALVMVEGYKIIYSYVKIKPNSISSCNPSYKSISVSNSKLTVFINKHPN